MDLSEIVDLGTGEVCPPPRFQAPRKWGTSMLRVPREELEALIAARETKMLDLNLHCPLALAIAIMRVQGDCREIRKELSAFKMILENINPAPTTSEAASQTDPQPLPKSSKKHQKDKTNQTEVRLKSTATWTSVDTATTGSQASIPQEVPSSEIGCQANLESPSKKLESTTRKKEYPKDSQLRNSQLKNNKPASNIVIKGIPRTTKLAPIVESLRTQGISAVAIRRLRSVKKNKIRKHVIVTLEKPSDEIFEIKNVCGYFIKCEPLKQREPTEDRVATRWKQLPSLRRPPLPRDVPSRGKDLKAAVNYVLDLLLPPK